MHHQRSELRAAVNKALDAFIEAHRDDEGGNPMRPGHGGLVTVTSTKARDEVARLRAAERELEGVIEVIRVDTPPSITVRDGKRVCVVCGPGFEVWAPADGRWLEGKVQVSIAPVELDET